MNILSTASSMTWYQHDPMHIISTCTFSPIRWCCQLINRRESLAMLLVMKILSITTSKDFAYQRWSLQVLMNTSSCLTRSHLGKMYMTIVSHHLALLAIMDIIIVFQTSPWAFAFILPNIIPMIILESSKFRKDVFQHISLVSVELHKS